MFDIDVDTKETKNTVALTSREIAAVRLNQQFQNARGRLLNITQNPDFNREGPAKRALQTRHDQLEKEWMVSGFFSSACFPDVDLDTAIGQAKNLTEVDEAEVGLSAAQEMVPILQEWKKNANWGPAIHQELINGKDLSSIESHKIGMELLKDMTKACKPEDQTRILQEADTPKQ